MPGKIGVFSFFSGAGFLDFGFEETGYFRTLFVNEYHNPFMDIYKKARRNLDIKDPEFGYHLNDVQSFLNEKNINKLRVYINKAREKYNLIGFIGGPPCPDFSVGGKNQGSNGENGKLTGTYVSLINKLSPDFFLFENVKGLWKTKKHRIFYEELKTKLKDNNYIITEQLINVIEFGVPQDRDRIILIGFKKSFLENHNYALNGTPYLHDFCWEHSKKYTREKIMTLPWPKKETFKENVDRKFPKGLPKELTVEYWFRENDVLNHENSKRFFMPKAGLTKFKTVEEGDVSRKSYKRPHRWRFSPTAAYGNNEVHLHPYKARRLSVAEALAIQSLPKYYILPRDITLTNAFKAIGNGVPYLAAKGLAFNIVNFLNKLKIKSIHYNETVNGAKHNKFYKPASKKDQLQLLEPKEQRDYKN